MNKNSGTDCEYINWYFKKSKEIGIKENIEKIPKNMLKRLGLTKEEFNKIYIKPYMSLSKHDLNITLDVLRAKLIETHAHKTNPVHYEFKLDIDKERKNNALTWLIFHISLLHIFELPNSITRNVITPYEQCYYCGKPNFYRKNNKTIKFNKKEIFCHKDLCKKGTNTKDHDNCCYELWHTKRKKIQRTLDSLIDRYSEIEAKVRAIELMQKASIANEDDLKNKEIYLIKINSIKSRTKEVLIDFCEKQYRENLKINYTIQTEKAKAIKLKKSHM